MEAEREPLPDVKPFNLVLSEHGLQLARGKTTTLQVNTGLLCNQSCRHCHLNAGPDRSEIMTAEVMDSVVAYARRCAFDVVDITGGAPELNPNLDKLITDLVPLAPRIFLRSNLTALHRRNGDGLMGQLASHRVVIYASLPSLNAAQGDAQRGDGIYDESLAALEALNLLGYGMEGTDLELNLVSNPTGAFVPAPQSQMEKRFRTVLWNKHRIRFNNLFNFGNAPLGRFRRWLIQSGNFASYMEKLCDSFNPCAVDGLMCRSLVSVSWGGYLYDCDFNLARHLYMGGRRIHVTDMPGLPEEGSSIAVSEHCYTCTAGEGFT